jgi:hypothetical protein
MMKDSDHSKQYPVFTCSYQCYRQGFPWLEEEQRLVKDFTDGGICILPTVVLLYCVLQSTSTQESSRENE